MENLRKIAGFSLNVYINSHISQLSYSELNERNNLGVESIAGESYDHIVLDENIREISATTADGKTYTYPLDEIIKRYKK